MKTNYATTGQSGVGKMLAYVALGALGMYMLDPVQGKRRRALVRDKLYSLTVKTRKAANATSRHLGNRMQGIRAETTGVISKLKHPASGSGSRSLH